MTENGWPQVGADGCEWITVPGTDVNLQIQKGQPLRVMAAVAADFHAYIEPLRDADSASWTPTNAVATSNHLGGTAMDLNWDSHPFHVRGTFNTDQMRTIRELLDFYEGVIFWAGDWDDPIDEMHWQMGYNTFQNPHTQDVINRKIRADGFSTFRRSDVPTPPLPPPPPPPSADPVAVLSDAMGGRLSPERYAQLLPAVRQCLVACQCNSVSRLSMWCAQIGHESGGLYYMEEIADGSAYEGRTDLGNTQPGDGRRFKGRGPIQVTGRHNYTQLSQWAFEQRLVPSPNFFVEHPEQLASDENGFLGVTWYWTVARPNINALCDVNDLEGVTRAINGGLNGLDDRRGRWDHARGIGINLYQLVGPPEEGFLMALSEGEQRELLDRTRQLWGALFNPIASKSRYGDPKVQWPTKDFVRNIDGHLFDLIVEHNAALGDPWSEAAVRTAASKGDAIAQAFLKRLQEPTPAVTAAPAPTPSRAAEPPPTPPAAPTPSPPQLSHEDVTAIVKETADRYIRENTPPAQTPTTQVVWQDNSRELTTGETIGKAYDALESLRLADALPIEGRAPLAALIAVLQTKNGSQLTS